MSKKVVIAIDPDCEKSGVGVVYRDTQQVMTYKHSFWQMLGFLRLTKDAGQDFEVIIEGGWLNKSNWHTTAMKGVQVAAEIGRRTGMNQQTGILLAEMCEAMDVPYTVVKPLRKCWRGRDGKITQAELERVTTGQKLPRMSQDQRDAVLLAWVYAGCRLKR